MADLLSSASSWLSGKLKDHASREVTLVRGNDSTAGVLASVGSSLLKVNDPVGNTRIERTDRDYLIEAADYLIGGLVVEPAKLDRIQDPTDGKVYQVMAPAGEAPWRYSDARRTRLRIHTVCVGAL